MIPDEGSSILKDIVFFVFCWMYIVGSFIFFQITDKKEREELLIHLKSVKKGFERR